MELISVKDRLPRDEGLSEVLAYSNGNYLVGYFHIYGNPQNIDCESIESTLSDVTHWMPLPEPPK